MKLLYMMGGFVVNKSVSPSLDPKQCNDLEKSQKTEAIFANDYDEDVNDEVVVKYCTNIWFHTTFKLFVHTTTF